MPTPTTTPSRKVTHAGVAGAFITLIVGILNEYVPFFQSKPISGAIAGAGATVLGFIVAYLVRPATNETVVFDENGVPASATH